MIGFHSLSIQVCSFHLVYHILFPYNFYFALEIVSCLEEEVAEN